MDPTLCEFEFPQAWAKLTEINRLGTYYGFIYHFGQPLGPMRKWTLNRGNGENSIVASGIHYDTGRCRAYTLTGSTGPLEGGRIPVDMKIEYGVMWETLALTGHFDPEENSLRGTEGWGDEFVFKRDPDFVRFYPDPSGIDARARWKFAMTAILDRIRRQSWSASYILKRIKEGKRYIELAIRDEHYGKRLDGDDRGEYGVLLSSLYEADARFYASRIRIKLSETTIQYVDARL